MFYGPIEYAEKHDRETLERLRQDVHAWTFAHQPFVAAWFPRSAAIPTDLRPTIQPNRLWREAAHSLSSRTNGWAN